jgi:aminoglycoside phosphotransferase (APT) family kinase protein
MIPEEKSAAVTQGLQEAFGVTAVDDMRMITRGRSPGVLVFRIVVQGNPYLLRIIMRADEAGRHYACMRAAAEAGLAPRVWYTSAEDKISITDFVETVPFPRADARVRMPAMLRALHALPPFPGVPHAINTSCMFLIHQGPVLSGFLGKFRAAKLLPEEECDELFARYDQVAAVYRRLEADMVSSHNDLFKPDNILFGGERVWLVDWEAAFLNDRYADLAVVANMIVTSEAEERAYLRAYFGEAPDEYQRARFFLMQQVAHMFYTMAFLFAGSWGKAEIPSGGAPGYEDFNRRFWEGEVDLVSADRKIEYGRVHWEKLKENVRLPRFTDALRVVG